MALSFVVVPLEMNTDVSFACPVCCDLVVFFEDSFEVIGVFFSNIFYSEIVDYQCELYWAGIVFP